MTRYAVEVTETALASIRAQARYIAEDMRAPADARHWLERLWDAVDSLERWPRRAPLAEENAHVEYEVRKRIVGDFLLLFTIDDEERTVWILGLRRGQRMARPGDLPEDPGENTADSTTP